MEKKPRRQGDVILNVIVGIFKQKGCICGNTVITKLQFFWGVRIWAFCSVEFPGWDEHTDCEESECKVVPGESKVQRQSFCTSAWGAGEWSCDTPAGYVAHRLVIWHTEWSSGSPSGHVAHNTLRVSWVSLGAGSDVLGNGKVGSRVFCANRRNVERLEATFSRLKAKCHAAD